MFIPLQENTLYLSSSYKWYSEYFNDDIVGFFRQYARGKLREEIKQHSREVNVKYLEYDWPFNGK
jgi:hypothetical protein